MCDKESLADEDVGFGSDHCAGRGMRPDTQKLLSSFLDFREPDQERGKRGEEACVLV